MDEYFMERLDAELEHRKRQEMVLFEQRDSPLTISPHGSDCSSEDDGSHTQSFHNLTFREVERSLERYHEGDDRVLSEMDVLITYLKGQKNVHLQSKVVCETSLNCLLIPTLVITAAMTISAPFMQEVAWSGGFISGLNAVTALLISLVKYLKLESAVELYHHTVLQYDKLETSLEFATSKLMFVQDASERSQLILEKIQETERKVSEIKEWNSQLHPARVLRQFPIICNINMFSVIKRIESSKRALIAKFKDIKNEIRYIEHQRRQMSDFNLERLEELRQVKRRVKGELLHYRNAYCYIDALFGREIQEAQGLKRHETMLPLKTNPVVDKYIWHTSVDISEMEEVQ
jgi:hypothetical protein